MVYRSTSASTLKKMSSWTLEKAYREKNAIYCITVTKDANNRATPDSIENDPFGICGNVFLM